MNKKTKVIETKENFITIKVKFKGKTKVGNITYESNKEYDIPKKDFEFVKNFIY